MTTLLPTDADNNPIPAMRLKASGGAHSISAAASSTRNGMAFDAATRVVSLYATVPVYVRFGGSSVTAAATDHYFPEGVYYDFSVGDGEKGPHATHVAVLALSSAGTVYISERE